VLTDFRVYLNTFLLKSNIHCKLNMLGLILTTTLLKLLNVTKTINIEHLVQVA